MEAAAPVATLPRSTREDVTKTSTTRSKPVSSSRLSKMKEFLESGRREIGASRRSFTTAAEQKTHPLPESSPSASDSPTTPDCKFTPPDDNSSKAFQEQTPSTTSSAVANSAAETATPGSSTSGTTSTAAREQERPFTFSFTSPTRSFPGGKFEPSRANGDDKLPCDSDPGRNGVSSRWVAHEDGCTVTMTEGRAETVQCSEGRGAESTAATLTNQQHLTTTTGEEASQAAVERTTSAGVMLAYHPSRREQPAIGAKITSSGSEKSDSGGTAGGGGSERNDLRSSRTALLLRSLLREKGESRECGLRGEEKESVAQSSLAQLPQEGRYYGRNAVKHDLAEETDSVQRYPQPFSGTLEGTPSSGDVNRIGVQPPGEPGKGRSLLMSASLRNEDSDGARLASLKRHLGLGSREPRGAGETEDSEDGESSTAGMTDLIPSAFSFPVLPEFSSLDGYGTAEKQQRKAAVAKKTASFRSSIFKARASFNPEDSAAAAAAAAAASSSSTSIPRLIVTPDVTAADGVEAEHARPGDASPPTQVDISALWDTFSALQLEQSSESVMTNNNNSGSSAFTAGFSVERQRKPSPSPGSTPAEAGGSSVKASSLLGAHAHAASDSRGDWASVSARSPSGDRLSTDAQVPNEGTAASAGPFLQDLLDVLLGGNADATMSAARQQANATEALASGHKPPFPAQHRFSSDLASYSESLLMVEQAARSQSTSQLPVPFVSNADQQSMENNTVQQEHHEDYHTDECLDLPLSRTLGTLGSPSLVQLQHSLEELTREGLLSVEKKGSLQQELSPGVFSDHLESREQVVDGEAAKRWGNDDGGALNLHEALIGAAIHQSFASSSVNGSATAPAAMTTNDPQKALASLLGSLGVSPESLEEAGEWDMSYGNGNRQKDLGKEAMALQEVLVKESERTPTKLGNANGKPWDLGRRGKELRDSLEQQCGAAFLRQSREFLGLLGEPRGQVIGELREGTRLPEPDGAKAALNNRPLFGTGLGADLQKMQGFTVSSFGMQVPRNGDLLPDVGTSAMIGAGSGNFYGFSNHGNFDNSGGYGMEETACLREGRVQLGGGVQGVSGTYAYNPHGYGDRPDHCAVEGPHTDRLPNVSSLKHQNQVLQTAEYTSQGGGQQYMYPEQFGSVSLNSNSSNNNHNNNHNLSNVASLIAGATLPAQHQLGYSGNLTGEYSQTNQFYQQIYPDERDVDGRTSAEHSRCEVAADHGSIEEATVGEIRADLATDSEKGDLGLGGGNGGGNNSSSQFDRSARGRQEHSADQEDFAKSNTQQQQQQPSQHMRRVPSRSAYAGTAYQEDLGRSAAAEVDRIEDRAAAAAAAASNSDLVSAGASVWGGASKVGGGATAEGRRSFMDPNESGEDGARGTEAAKNTNNFGCPRYARYHPSVAAGGATQTAPSRYHSGQRSRLPPTPMAANNATGNSNGALVGAPWQMDALTQMIAAGMRYQQQQQGGGRNPLMVPNMFDEMVASVNNGTHSSLLGLDMRQAMNASQVQKPKKVYLDDRDRMVYVSWIPKKARAYNDSDKRKMELDLKKRLREGLLLPRLAKVLLFPPKGVHCKLIFETQGAAAEFMSKYGGDNGSDNTEQWKVDLCRVYDIDMHEKFDKTIVKIEWSQK